MEYSAIISLITSLGLPTAIAIILWNKQNKSDEEHKKNIILKDDQNRKDTQALIDRQDKRIEGLEESAKEDKIIFKETVNSFNNAVKSFESINTNVINIQDKLSTMEQDITIIKVKMEK